MVHAFLRRAGVLAAFASWLGCSSDETFVPEPIGAGDAAVAGDAAGGAGRDVDATSLPGTGGTGATGGTSGTGGGPSFDATLESNTDARAVPGEGPLLGWYTGAGRSDTSALPVEAAAGANLIVAYYDAGVGTATAKAFLDRLEALGMRALLQVDKAWIAPPDTVAITDLVTAVHSHPALYGYLLFDEPEFNAISPTELQAAYDVVRGADPAHPVAVSFGNGYCSYADRQGAPTPTGATYMTIPDIVLFAQYPVHDQAEFAPTSDGRHALTDIPQMVDDCMTYLSAHHGPHYQGFVSILQAFAWSATERDPTYRESRFMFFRSLIADPFAAVFWVDYRASAAMSDTANRLIREASGIGPALRQSTFKSGASIHYAVGSSGGVTYLVATNDGDAAVTGATFTLPVGTAATSVDVLNDKFDEGTGQYVARTITPAAGTFADDFAPFEVHVYEVR